MTENRRQNAIRIAVLQTLKSVICYLTSVLWYPVICLLLKRDKAWI